MQLADFLKRVAVDYDRANGLQTDAQHLLRSASSLLTQCHPPGYVVKGSGGKGSATFTPWIGFFDPDITERPQSGLYVVYIFSSDLGRLFLSLNQGMEDLRSEHGDAAARSILAADAAEIRSRLLDREAFPVGFDAELQLGLAGPRAKAYSAGNIACRAYATQNLPSEHILQGDLQTALELLAHAAVLKDRILVEQPGVLSTSGSQRSSVTPILYEEFRPKDDAEYLAEIGSHTQLKSRRHETLVTRFAQSCQAAGLRVSSPHPMDLIFDDRAGTHLVEAKTIRNGNATDAVRQAIGQLFTYRHFFFADRPVRLVALFSDRVGRAYAQLLADLQIQCIWWEQGEWASGAGDFDISTLAGLPQMVITTDS